MKLKNIKLARWQSISLKVFLVIFIIFIMIYVETYLRALENMRIADRYYKKKDYKQAVLYYQTVITFYTPFSKLVVKAFEKILEIGDYYLERKKYKDAVEAYEEIPHSIYAIRSFYVPHMKYFTEVCKRLYKVGKIYEEMKNYEEAIIMYKKSAYAIIDVAGYSPAATYVDKGFESSIAIAKMYAQRKDFKAAEKVLQDIKIVINKLKGYKAADKFLQKIEEERKIINKIAD